MPNYYLNSYTPLVARKPGRLASSEFGISPFVDGSIRREPDLTHKCPSITCLCRAGKFVPRLNVGDTIAYLTCKVRFGGSDRVQRLTAVLRVKKELNNHQEAAEWYLAQNQHLPSNCMMPSNPPEPLERSHCIHRGHVVARTDTKAHRLWDAEYRLRAKRYPKVVVCDPLFINVTAAAPTVEERHFAVAFGKKPGTQNPGVLTHNSFRRFLEAVGVNIELGGR